MDDQATATQALAVAVAARVPVLLWGAPGTGKTSAIRAMADAAGWPCETVIASIREPSDFAGLPIVVGNGTGEGAQVDFAPPRWARRLADAGQGMLFFDEVSTAPPAVQAALLRVVLERTVGDLALPDPVSVVAAANPPEQAADGWDLSPPLANRFCHLEWPADARTLADGFAAGWRTPAPPQLSTDWSLRIAVTRSWVAGFITARPTLAVEVPTEAAAAGRAWPSPRTWDMAARLLAASEGAVVDDLVRSLLIRGSVGQGAGVEFLTWLIEADLPDPELVLEDPSSFELPARGDRAYAALTSIGAAVAARPTPERWAAAWVVFGAAGEAAPDVAAVAARTLVRCRPPGAPVPAEVAAFAPLLRDAGLLE
jgi:MoxR-like ATPase